MKHVVNCIICGTQHTLNIDATKLSMYNAGFGKIQDLFPELTANERELLVSGICGKCYDSIMEDDE